MNSKPISSPCDEFQDPLKNYDPKVYCDPLMKALAEEKVTSVQYRPVAAISPQTTIREAVQALSKLKVACLLIEEAGRLVGVFSDRDVLDKVALEYDTLRERPVSEVMTRDPVCVFDSDSSAAALSVMAVCGFRHVPVIDVKHQVVGIVSPQRVTEFLRKQLVK